MTLDNKYRRIFTGWMFASSPGLHAIEHPIYDVWLVDCKGGSDVIAEAKEQEDVPAVAAKPEKAKRAGRDATKTAQQLNAAGQVDVEAPRGVPVQPRQKPSRNSSRRTRARRRRRRPCRSSRRTCSTRCSDRQIPNPETRPVPGFGPMGGRSSPPSS